MLYMIILSTIFLLNYITYIYTFLTWHVTEHSYYLVYLWLDFLHWLMCLRADGLMNT